MRTPFAPLVALFLAAGPALAADVGTMLELEHERASLSHEDAVAWRDILREQARVQREAVAVARLEVSTARAQVRAAALSEDPHGATAARARLARAEQRVDAALADAASGRLELRIAGATLGLARAEIVAADRALDLYALRGDEGASDTQVAAVSRAERRVSQARERQDDDGV